MKTRNILLSLALAASGLAANAQYTYSGYFTDGNLYRHTLNPAFANTDNYFSFPGLGNVNIGFQGNLHLKSIFYNVNGRTTTFLNPNVPAATVLKNIHSSNELGAEFGISLVSVGFKALGGYNTVEVGVKGGIYTAMPGSLFSFLKEGVTNDTYDIRNFDVRAQAYGEIALGHSRQLSDQWRVGAKVKFLLGIGDLSAKFNDAKLALDYDKWVVTSNATVNSSVKGLSYKTALSQETGKEYVKGLDYDSFGLNGFGLALDLGAEYRHNDDWTFSAALVDLGFISWFENHQASTNGAQTIDTSTYVFSADNDADNSFEKEWNRFSDDICNLYQLADNGNTGSRATGIATTVNLAAQYTFPLYRPLSFGLMNTTRIFGKYTTTDFRLSANVAPVKVFSATADIAYGTYGFDFGWMLNLHCTGFNFFVGMDHTLGKLAKQGIPLSSNGEVNLGINFIIP